MFNNTFFFQVVTGSRDGTVKIWDARTNSCTGTYTQPDKVYTMSLAGEKLVVGTASRKVNKAELPQEGILFCTQFPSLEIFVNKKLGFQKTKTS